MYQIFVLWEGHLNLANKKIRWGSNQASMEVKEESFERFHAIVWKLQDKLFGRIPDVLLRFFAKKKYSNIYSDFFRGSKCKIAILTCEHFIISQTDIAVIKKKQLC